MFTEISLYLGSSGYVINYLLLNTPTQFASLIQKGPTAACLIKIICCRINKYEVNNKKTKQPCCNITNPCQADKATTTSYSLYTTMVLHSTAQVKFMFAPCKGWLVSNKCYITTYGSCHFFVILTARNVVNFWTIRCTKIWLLVLFAKLAESFNEELIFPVHKCHI